MNQKFLPDFSYAAAMWGEELEKKAKCEKIQQFWKEEDSTLM